MKRWLSIPLLVILLSCSTNPYRKTDKIYKSQLKAFQKQLAKKDTSLIANGSVVSFIGTTNFNLRKPNFVIIHHTAQESLEQTIKTFTLSRTQVSAHYVIADDGKVIQMLNDYLRGWHAGSGSWGKNFDINSTSIGIELDNNGIEPFSTAQVESLLQLLDKLKKKYNIPAQNFIGHSDITPTRKSDPSKLFPWKILAEKGFGLWPSQEILNAPALFDAVMGLQIIGYNTKNLPASIKAFKLHYNQIEIDEILDQKTINLIYNIYKQQL